MAHIALPEGLPGIFGPLTQYPETAKPLGELAEVLLRGCSGLTPGERELIAAYVSAENECTFCTNAHSAIARHLLSEDPGVVEQVRSDFERAPISEKLKALLVLAGKVQKGGCHVTEKEVARARAQGATDRDIHDTVLIAAAFCMYNRYVDGLATWAPESAAIYDAIGVKIAMESYVEEEEPCKP